MVDLETLKIFGQVAGLAGLCLGVLLIIFRDIIRRNIVPDLTKEHAYRLLRLIVVLVWTLAVLGLGTWAFSNLRTTKNSSSILGNTNFGTDHTLAVDTNSRPNNSMPPAQSDAEIKKGQSKPESHPSNETVSKKEVQAQPSQLRTWLLGRWTLRQSSVSKDGCFSFADEWNLEVSQQNGQLVGTITRHRLNDYTPDVLDSCRSFNPLQFSESSVSYNARFDAAQEKDIASFEGVLRDKNASGNRSTWVYQNQTLHGTVRRLSNLQIMLSAVDNYSFNDVTLERQSW